MEPLSACIISFNEEDRIEACIRSLQFCDEILVLDSEGSDEIHCSHFVKTGLPVEGGC